MALWKASSSKSKLTCHFLAPKIDWIIWWFIHIGVILSIDGSLKMIIQLSKKYLPKPQVKRIEYSSFVGIVNDFLEKQSVLIGYFVWLLLGDLGWWSASIAPPPPRDFSAADNMDFSVFQLQLDIVSISCTFSTEFIISVWIFLLLFSIWRFNYLIINESYSNNGIPASMFDYFMLCHLHKLIMMYLVL